MVPGAVERFSSNGGGRIILLMQDQKIGEPAEADKTEIRETLNRLRAELEDLEETIAFNFMNTSAHIGGGQVRKDEEALKALREKISSLERRLEGR